MPFPTEVFLFLALIATGFMVSRATNLFAAAMLTGVFSLTSACLFTVMDAVDVAFTEAAVGGGFSTVLFLGALALTRRGEKRQPAKLYPFIIVLLTGIALIVGMINMKPYGDQNTPIHNHVAAKIKQKEWAAVKRSTRAAAKDANKPHDKAVGLPNIVTSILGSYRGYDTLGETGVIFTAGIGVMLLLMGRRRDEDGSASDAVAPKDGEQTSVGEPQGEVTDAAVANVSVEQQPEQGVQA